MAKRRVSTDIDTATTSAGDEIDRHFSTWLNGVEDFVKRLFVPDNVHHNRAVMRTQLEDARQLAELMGTEVSVLYFADALERAVTPEQCDRAAAIAKAAQATRKQVADLIGRDEAKAWGNDKSDKYGERGASFDPAGVMIALGPYWSHIRFIGDQIASLGIYPKRMRHADVGGTKKEVRPLAEGV
jgi:hypothetical protein